MRTLFALLAVVSINAFAADGATDQVAQGTQCYNGDDGKFYNVGEKASISGVAVTCEAMADKKNAQWMSDKHGK